MNQHAQVTEPFPIPLNAEPPLMIEDFQQGFRELAAGVCLVTTREGGEDLGIAATSVSSLSAEPPSLLVCINRKSGVHDRLLKAGKFCVNVLADEHKEISACFGSPSLKHQRFVTGDWDDRDVPVLADALASFQCTVGGSHSFGTHSIIVGTITCVETRSKDRDPLLYFRGDYR